MMQRYDPRYTDRSRRRAARARRRRGLFLAFTVAVAAGLTCLLLTAWRDLASVGRIENGVGRTEDSGLSAILHGSVLSAPEGNNTGDIAVPGWIVQDLLPVNEYSRPGDALPQVNGVVVHYVGNPGTTAEQNRSYFAGLAETHETSASSHFLVGIDGTVIQCVPLGEISYCSNDRNADTIAIECCHPDDTGAFTPETLDALERLLDWLIDTYDLEREDILRHYDVTGKECPRYYVKNPEAWEALLDTLDF